MILNYLFRTLMTLLTIIGILAALLTISVIIRGYIDYCEAKKRGKK